MTRSAKWFLSVLILIGTLLSAPAVFGGEGTAGSAPALQTVTLAVDGMVCSACPYIVRKSLLNLPGVRAAEVSGESGRAVVTMDPAVIDPGLLVAATSDIGFPSRIVDAATP